MLHLKREEIKMTKTMKKVEELKTLAEQKGLVLTIVDEPTENKELHYWYGGQVATVSKGNNRILVEANGDVRCWYRDNDTEIYVKDKNNGANFYHELNDVIESDEALCQCLNNFNEEKFPQLEVDNNNWWELFVEVDGQWFDIMYNLDVDTYSEAVEYAIEHFDEVIKEAIN